MVNFWAGKRVLVTGGRGFLGKRLIKHLYIRGCQSQSVFAPHREDYDLTIPARAEAMLQDVGDIDILFHLAADVGGIGYNQENGYQLFYTNAIMGINLIHLSLLYGVKKFVQIGTTCSYPAYCPPPFKESDLWDGYPEETNAPYGLAKRVLLAQLQAARRHHAFNGIYIIPANLYGPGDDFSDEKSHVIPALIKKITGATDTLTVWGTGNATRDFLYVDDAARGIITIAEKYDGAEPVNLGSGHATAISALVNIIKELTGCRAKTTWDVSKPDGQMTRLLGTSKARSLGWEPEVSLHEGLKMTIDWYKEQYA